MWLSLQKDVHIILSLLYFMFLIILIIIVVELVNNTYITKKTNYKNYLNKMCYSKCFKNKIQLKPSTVRQHKQIDLLKY